MTETVLFKVFPVNNLGPFTWCTGYTFGRDTDGGLTIIIQTAFINKLFNIIRKYVPSLAFVDGELMQTSQEEQIRDLAY